MSFMGLLGVLAVACSSSGGEGIPDAHVGIPPSLDGGLVSDGPAEAGIERRDATLADAAEEDAEAPADAAARDTGSMDADGAPFDATTVGDADAQPTDGGAESALGDAADEDDGAKDAIAADALDSDAPVDAAEEAAEGGDATARDGGIVLGQFVGPGVFTVDCNAAPPSESFVVSNPTDQTLTWTSAVTSVDNGPTPVLVPAGSTLDPGQSVTVAVQFPVWAVPSRSNPTITITDGVKTTQLAFLETVDGYVAAANDVDFGVVMGPPTLTAATLVSVDAPEVGFVGSTCVLFSLSGGTTANPDVTFTVNSCGAGIPQSGFSRAANVIIGLNVVPSGGPPPTGTFVGTFSLGASTAGPLCNAPVTFRARVTLVGPDGGP